MLEILALLQAPVIVVVIRTVFFFLMQYEEIIQIVRYSKTI